MSSEIRIMNCVNLKILSQMCLAGTVVAFWSSTQEMGGLKPFTVITTTFVTEFSEFNEIFFGKLKYRTCCGHLLCDNTACYL